MILLWLDDMRDPLKNDWLNFSPIPKMELSDVVWVQNYEQFVQWVQQNGLPDGVSFDHDLCREHMTYFFDNGGRGNPPDPSKANFKEKTGYDCARWLCEYCSRKGLDLPPWGVHSANPHGSANIRNLLNSFKRAK